MELSRNDWRDYADFLTLQLKDDVTLLNSKESTILSYNNFRLMAEIDNVNTTKIYVKS